MALFGKAAQLIGLDIGSDVIRVAQIKQSSDLILSGHGELKTQGCLADGEATDVEALASSISELWKKAQISDRNVVLGVANQKVIVRLLTMPYMEKEDLKSAVQFQAQDNIPIPMDEAILDYQVINDFTNKDDERSIQIILVAAQKEMIQNHIAAVEKAKLKPYAVEVSSFALGRSLLGNEPVVPDDKQIEKNEKPIGILDIGESVTNISIIKNRIPLFSRVITIGENTFVKAVADALAIQPEEAKKIKTEIGFSKQSEELTKDLKKDQLEKGEKVRTVLSDEAIRFVGEVKRSFEYGLTETVGNEDLSELIVSGMLISNENLLSYFEDAYVKVNTGDALSKVSLPAGQTIDNQSSYAISIGLALRGLDE